MTIQVLKKEESKVSIAQETSKFTLAAVVTLTGLIGIWALTCLIGGLSSSGAVAFIKGYITAVTGF